MKTYIHHPVYYYLVTFLIFLFVSCTKDSDFEKGQENETAYINNKGTLDKVDMPMFPDDVIEHLEALSLNESSQVGTSRNVTVVETNSSGAILHHNLSLSPNGFVFNQSEFPLNLTFDRAIVFNNSTNAFNINILSDATYLHIGHLVEPGALQDINVENDFMIHHGVSNALGNSYFAFAHGPVSGSVYVYLYHDYY